MIVRTLYIARAVCTGDCTNSVKLTFSVYRRVQWKCALQMYTQLSAFSLYTARLVYFIHTLCVSAVRCVYCSYTPECNVRCLRMWSTCRVLHPCTTCAKSALLCGKLAATRKFCVQQHIAGSKRCVCGTLLCRKVADFIKFREQKYAIFATYRACSDTQTYGEGHSCIIL